ncbi:hypothetical protein [Methylobacterium sp. CCH5-D2]|uniref:hypothetical protein n=1 Tax=Methylobacterium sp. CCH5-D2 TaxID=1768765 RepID=UPI000830E731|nr:hypothetical protein [Methylobacterium sp. CCH5-D2]
MNETVFEVAFVEGAGWRVMSEGKLVASVHNQERAKDRAILNAKRVSAQGGVGVVRIFAKAGGLYKEHAYGRQTARLRIEGSRV